VIFCALCVSPPGAAEQGSVPALTPARRSFAAWFWTRCSRPTPAATTRKPSTTFSPSWPASPEPGSRDGVSALCHAKVGPTKCVLSEMRPLLLLLWWEQHPEGHEQVMIDFTVRECLLSRCRSFLEKTRLSDKDSRTVRGCRHRT
jgi:hypothetical protein